MKYKFINILLFLASLVFLLLLFMYEEELENYHTEMYVVEPGDTAWKIMNQNNSANKDIRELIKNGDEMN